MKAIIAVRWRHDWLGKPMDSFKNYPVPRHQAPISSTGSSCLDGIGRRSTKGCIT